MQSTWKLIAMYAMISTSFQFQGVESTAVRLSGPFASGLVQKWVGQLDWTLNKLAKLARCVLAGYTSQNYTLEKYTLKIHFG